MRSRRALPRRALPRPGLPRAALVAVLGLAGGGCAWHGASATPVALSGASQPPSRIASAAPLRLVSITPHRTLAPTGPITVTLSAPVAATSPTPTLVPGVRGSWLASGDTWTFTPAAAYPPDVAVTVQVPGGSGGVRAADGATLPAGASVTLAGPTGSVLRAQQILARLGYLPLTTSAPVPSGPAGELAAVYAPSGAGFAWRYPNVPAPLAALWSPGGYGVLTRGAVMAFQYRAKLTIDGLLGPATWAALVRADQDDAVDPQRYSFVEADLSLPQRLTVWVAGSTVVSSPVNSGIAGARTPLGTFPVYVRYRIMTMSGTNPDGTRYSDPEVPYSNFFTGGDAVHGFPRSAYGYPQSVGCLELPVPTAARVYALIGYGTLVTVFGDPTQPRR